jgi:hypothetical protein
VEWRLTEKKNQSNLAKVTVYYENHMKSRGITLRVRSVNLGSLRHGLSMEMRSFLRLSQFKHVSAY